MEPDVSFDLIWLLLTTALVFLMQAGFLCLETGLTRSKNNINVALKNLVDFALSSALFVLVGFGLMYGTSLFGLFGASDFLPNFSTYTPVQSAFFLFQVMFCGTAVTIISGSAAERMHFHGYLIVSILVSAFVYPVFGHWAWAGYFGQGTGFLQALGFYDFAGSTVVHSIGGWAGLAVILLIGPRLGRFGPNGEVNRINGANTPLAALGVFILYIGWIGFNGGSTFGFTSEIFPVLVNTLVAGSVGLLAAAGLSYLEFGRADTSYLMNGLLAGLVSVTAGANLYSTLGAILVGLVGAGVMILASRLLIRLRIDDPIDAIPVHLGAGIWGTLAVGLFGNIGLINPDLTRIEAIGVQALGSLLAAVWGFGTVYAIGWVFNRFSSWRVSDQAQMAGLNISEHAASTELVDFLSVLNQQAESPDLSMRAPVEPFTEVGQIAKQYNRVMDRLEETDDRVQNILSNAPVSIFSVRPDGEVALAQGISVQRLQITEGRNIQPVLTLNPLFAVAYQDAVDLNFAECYIDVFDACFHVRMRPLLSRNETFNGVVGIITDITERRRAEEKEEQYVQMLSDSADLSEQISSILNVDHLIKVTLDEIYSRFGIDLVSYFELNSNTSTLVVKYEPGETGMSRMKEAFSISLAHPSSLIAQAARTQTRVLAGDVSQIEGYLAHDEFEAVGTELALPILYREQLYGVLDFQDSNKELFSPKMIELLEAVARQLSIAISNADGFEKQKRFEEKLLDALANAEEANRAKTQMLASVSHELRTPLGAIIGYTEMMQDGKYGEVSEQQTERLDLVLGSAEHLRGLINQLIDTARLEMEEAPAHFSRVEIEPLLSVIYREMHGISDQKGLLMRLEIAPNMVKDVDTDPGLMRQLLINLIGNAIKFTDQGGVGIFVGLASDTHWRCVVKDTGIGIKSENINSIFEPFKRVQELSIQSRPGTGLGLSITKSLVERLDGTIDVKSAFGKGSEFTVTFPIDKFDK